MSLDQLPFDESFGNLNHELITDYWAFNIGPNKAMKYPFIVDTGTIPTVSSPNKSFLKDLLISNKKYVLENHYSEENVCDEREYYSSSNGSMDLINHSSKFKKIRTCKLKLFCSRTTFNHILHTYFFVSS